MSQFKEFTDKDLDAAILAACDHFAVSREKLEIEIISNGSSGIFGLMSKKAVVKARLRVQREPFADLMSDTPILDRAERAAMRREAAEKVEEKAVEPAPAPQEEPEAEDRPAPAEAAPAQEAPRAAQPAEAAPVQARTEDRGAEDATPENGEFEDEDTEDEPTATDTRLPEPDQETLNRTVREVVERLLEPVIGSTTLVVTNEPGRIKVLIDDEENSGLIIGREGQTITALQYITNRILARKFQTSVRVHLDAGDYRDKQDENLRKLALYLADKAKDQGRTQSTKPLSSYHRRLVHMALQNDDSVSTRSKGDGPLKRVLIFPSGNGNRRSGGRPQRGA